MSAAVTDLSVPLLVRQIDALAEAITALAATAQQPAEPQSSVELVQNSKGATQIAVKIYHRDPQQAAAAAQVLYDELAATYRAGAPVPDGKSA
jgi:hemoglobin-like flavoprotein